ncbi:MAG: hypothetical protein O3A00_18405 [Planctomycetota bacterium]|nr:hypothetical protein [Planctomycetota bacterium]
MTERLVVAPDNNDHGTIQPAFLMPHAVYKQSIYDTQDLWMSGEADDE